jgi:hypothetical protein
MTDKLLGLLIFITVLVGVYTNARLEDIKDELKKMVKLIEEEE